MVHKFLKLFLTFVFVWVGFYGFTQSIDQANTFYKEGNYAAAKPVFEKLVRQSPNNSNYNLFYGVCCYETGDLEAAEKYLIVANKRKVIDSYRHLAELYMKTYRFDEAITMWDGYIDLQKKKKDDTSDSEAKLNQARNLLRKQENTEDVQIIDSVVIAKNMFLEVYSLSAESGNLLYYNDFFDVPQTNSSVVYQNEKGDKIYYGRPSNQGLNTLYSQNKLLDAWSDEKQLLPDDTSDNNYPFVLSDGVTMYFSSTGYGSIGGYDIFITRYNTNTNTYLAPEQMGMPFNSPANDYMMVIDETKGLGWFVSDRNQPVDSVCVYLFIPDPSPKRLKDLDDPGLLRRRSALTSIRDTWNEEADYVDLIRLAYQDTRQQDKKAERDFTFVVNDKTVYHTLSEIKSNEARNYYSETLSINKQIGLLNDKLNGLRDSYANGNKAMRDQLKSSILQIEDQLYDLMEEAQVMEKQARNTENLQIGFKY